MSMFRRSPGSKREERDSDEIRELLKRVRRIELRSRKNADNVLSGEYKTVFKGTGIEFEEVREYQRGDDVRSIDWNVTARMGHLFVKKYREERELTVLLLVDVSASQFTGSDVMTKKDLAEEISAVLGFSAGRSKDKVGLVLFSDRVEKYIPAQKGTSHLMRILREVLAMNPVDRTTDIGQALEFVNKILKRKAIIFLLSDFFDSGFMRTAGMTARRHDLVPIILRDRMETDLPAAGVLCAEDPETGRMVYLDTGSPLFRERWREYAGNRDEELRKNFRRHNIDSLTVMTGSNYMPPLMQFFRMRAARY